jgi:hypothetical protein
MYHKIVSKRREITITFCHRDGHSLHSPNIFLLIDSRNILSGLLEGNHRRENSKFAMHGWRRWWRQDSSYRNHSLLRVARLCKNESRSRRSWHSWRSRRSRWRSRRRSLRRSLRRSRWRSRRRSRVKTENSGGWWGGGRDLSCIKGWWGGGRDLLGMAPTIGGGFVFGSP